MRRLPFLILIITVCFTAALGQAARKSQTPRLIPELSRNGCEWFFLGFYLDMPEVDALKHIKAISTGEYERADTGEVNLSVTEPKYSYVDRIFLRFAHARLTSISATLGSPLTTLHIDQITHWLTKRYQLPDEWEVNTKDKDTA